MRFADRFEKGFRYLMPSPFALAVILTFIAIALATIFCRPDDSGLFSYWLELGQYWEKGMWKTGALAFAVQMMLILVLGHVMALSPPVNRLIEKLAGSISSSAGAAVMVCLSSILVSYLNWGLGLIFGAILARKVGEVAAIKKVAISYPLIGACAYSGLMIWHGGLSGSAPLKAAQPGSLQELVGETGLSVPDSVGIGATVVSPMNILVVLLTLVVLPLLAGFLGKRLPTTKFEELPAPITTKEQEDFIPKTPAEKIDHKKIVGWAVGCLIILYAIIKVVSSEQSLLHQINPNYINLLLLGGALVLHGSFVRFLSAVEKAISGASGILIQFPLYFGIMGIMISSGMVSKVAQLFAEYSSAQTFPIYTFFSAGLINLFVPSGGGQWLVQGPLIVETAMAKGIDLGKCIMAMAYGDQLTNMLQPFWALPLLGVTGLKARAILPYTLLFMIAGIVLFLTGLLIF